LIMNYGKTETKSTTADSDLIDIKNYILNEADIGRRVLCLYRVSTDKQLTYNERAEADIPMQRRTCRRFLEQQGWILVHEEREDGISGHKVRAEKRDSIQHIKELAIGRKFDILLVFMFDRIGRIADETPFVVEWLIKHGVRVWSINEGEQRLDTHTDKLMNYIRFWQADGESEKTSVRTKAGMGLLVESGHYKGGNAPYGYMLIKSGRIDKKGNEKKNLAINEEEAVIVRKIFDLYVHYGFGTRRITTVLIQEGIKTRTGRNFSQSTVKNMIHNMTYTGVLRSGTARSAVIEELQIVTPALFQKAQDILKKRNTDAADSRTYPMNTESRCLLNGKIYCADCGSRLIVTANGRFVIDNGIKQKRLRYMCYKKSKKLADCQGQTGYSVKRLDDLVDGVVRYIFDRMQDIPKSEVINSGVMALKREQETIYNTAQRELIEKGSDLAGLKAEVMKSIRGESKYSPELLSSLLADTEKEFAEIEVIKNIAKQRLNDSNNRILELQAQYDEVISWTELYDTMDLSAKKMIIANLINRIDVGKDYQIHVDFNIDLTIYGIKPDAYTCGQEKTA